ncbi:Stage VI sporulation protein D [compost metagenome]
MEQQREEQVQAEIQSILSAEKGAYQEDEPVSGYEPAFELSADPVPEPEPEQEKQELRIAFSGKQPEDSGDSSVQDVGILTLLQTSRREQAAREAIGQAVAEEKAAEEARDQAAGDEIEWKRLFLGKQSEDSEFRKIRMCIVQKDETLDEIAVRYSMNPREIVIYNRLDESGLSEGQILYIPQL